MTFPETERVIYKKSPLAEVVCQFRFSANPQIVNEAPTAFRERIQDQYPNFEQKIGVINGMSSPLPPQALEQIEKDPNLRRATTAYEFTSSGLGWQVTLTRNAFTLTCQHYQRWEAFKEHLVMPLDALISVYAPAHFERISLRYQDVIHRSYLDIPHVAWSELLQPYIVGELASELIAEHVEQKYSQVVINLDVYKSKVHVYHGLAAVQGDLKNETSETGYIIDGNFFTDQPMETTDAILVLDAFNAEARRFFRWCITDKLHHAMQPTRIMED